MLIVNCSLMQNDIIKLVEGIVVNDNKFFKFVEKKGVKIYFDLGTIPYEEAAIVIKNEIKKSDLGALLYFSILKA